MGMRDEQGDDPRGEEGTEGEQGFNLFGDMLRSMAASTAARRISVVVAGIQAEHYHKLIDEGMSEEVALHITTETSKDILELVKVASKHADVLAQACATILDWNQKRSED